MTDISELPISDVVERLREAIEAERAARLDLQNTFALNLKTSIAILAEQVRGTEFSVDALLADLSRLASLPQSGMGWRPIETAPKDGTTILLTDARIQDWTLTAAWIQGEISKSYCWETYDGLGYHAETFTHWMPLPPPPGSEPIAPVSHEEPAIDRHWRVTVSRSGEQIVAIEPEILAGREISSADEEAIRAAGENLLAFIGAPQPIRPEKYVDNFGESIAEAHEAELLVALKAMVGVFGNEGGRQCGKTAALSLARAAIKLAETK